MPEWKLHTVSVSNTDKKLKQQNDQTDDCGYIILIFTLRVRRRRAKYCDRYLDLLFFRKQYKQCPTKFNIMKTRAFFTVLMHAGYFGVSIIQQNLTWTTGSLNARK